MKKIDQILKQRVLILDGAVGTQLQKMGLPCGVSPEIWCVQNPNILMKLHQEYIQSGSDVIYTATFGANRIKLAQFGCKSVPEINNQLALIAKKAAGKNALVAGGIGPTGELIEPFGNLKFEEAVNIFKEQVKSLLKAGVDFFVIETMIDIQEARAALIAVSELTDKFRMVSMTFEPDGNTLGGTPPEAALITLQSLGASAFGCNCSTGPEAMVDIIRKIKPYATIPLLAKPNAGFPRLSGGKTIFTMNSKEFAKYSVDLVKAGANILGGCCGTDPEYIKALIEKIKHIKPKEIRQKNLSALSSARKSIILGDNMPLVVVGECINPTGKKELSSQLKKGQISLLRDLAKQQQQKGADILDVNISVGQIDEQKLIIDVVSALSNDTHLPLVIDSSTPEVIEKFLRLYPGRALINSISADNQKMKKLLNIASRYGAMFILLPISGKNIPKNLPEKKKNINTIIREAKKVGFNKDGFIIDALALSISANPNSAYEILETIKWAKENGHKTVIGLSNVSFGMPQRALLNSTFLILARSKGLDCVIANPLSSEVTNAKKAVDLLLREKGANKRFFQNVNDRLLIIPDVKNLNQVEKEIYQLILEGRKEQIKKAINKAVANGVKAQSLIDKVLVPALEQTGKLFDQRIYFLPQLISVAETAKIVFGLLQAKLKTKKTIAKKAIVILATVKGDIHDIGKNIVALMLENYGFKVIDLGKDVSAEKIINAAIFYKASLIGLSALMTTTMINMKDVVELAKTKKIECKFLIGGAVVTQNYAKTLGAEYASDGLEAVRAAKRLVKSTKIG